MNYREKFKEENNMYRERYDLTMERIAGIANEHEVPEPFDEYFREMADFLMGMRDLYVEKQDGVSDDWTIEQLAEENRALYQDLMPENYETSYANPAYAVEVLGETFGRILSFLYTELRGEITYAFEQRLFDMTIVNELFIEIYNLFEDEEVTYHQIKDAVYWYVSDYCGDLMRYRLREQFDTDMDFATSIIMEEDLSDLRYLYQFGEYIGPNELETARFLNSLPEEELEAMAFTYTDGYREGFQVMGMDISIKETVDLLYNVGFEPMVKKAIEQFKEIHLDSLIYRAASHSLNKRGLNKRGYTSTSPNRQYEFDHKDDQAIYLDKALVARKLECLKESYAEYEAETKVYGGPAVIEIFGEKPFDPISKPESYSLNEHQQELTVSYSSQSRPIINQYIDPEQRSFTIIAYPLPDIGEEYEKIFAEIVKVNTLDKKLYREIQQHLIDALDQAVCVRVRGKGDNCTDITVQMHDLADPATQTNFENCLADVNIPVGEVFTSPKLTGTAGVLNVSEVFLEGLSFKNLKITFEDGKIKDYTCSNFDNEEDNLKLIQDNILFHHETLPIGEFAIGTNTTAYVMAHAYDIVYKLPILIAEKMGPHFAVGDTCYSFMEEAILHNPDGKLIVATENECSALRKTDPANAYFNCHTDITIPYEELESIKAIRADGSEIALILDGRFVLPGTEALNKPFDEYIKR